MAVGYIHSIESMGLVDGPGVRFVVFMQGCMLRCKYCHNPDTWNLNGGQSIEADELFGRILRYKPYFESSGGGVTVSGGEPLLQAEFLAELFEMCKREKIHTAIDTAGGVNGDFGRILELTDLVLLDIKHTNPEEYFKITGCRMDMYENFTKQLKEHRTDVWLRTVIVPGINDTRDYIMDVWDAAKHIPGVKKIELLPYHTLGVTKYHEMGIKYPLEGVSAMEKSRVGIWQDKLNLALIADDRL